MEVEDVEEEVEGVAEDEVRERTELCMLCLLTQLTVMQVCIYTNQVRQGKCMHIQSVLGFSIA